MLTFTNSNPTETEKKMYLYAGFYLIEKTKFHSIYAVCYTDSSERKMFPMKINIEEKRIDHDSMIIFDPVSEQVKIKGYVDAEVLQLVQDRIKELGWIERKYEGTDR